MDLTLQEIQAIIQSTPRPCSLVIRRGTGLDEISQPLTFLQCQARGPAFLCSVQDPKQKETVDLYLTLAHLNTLSPKLLASHTVTKELLARGLTPATLLRSTTSEWTTEESTSTSDSDVSTSLALDMSLYQDRPGSNGLDSSCVTCDEPMTNNASQLLKNLQSKVEWLLYQYVTSVQGASRMAYLNGAKFAAWTLAHVVSDPELLRGFYFYAHACDLQKCFAGLRIGMTMIATGAENMANTLSPENLLHLSCIMPNSSELCKFVNRNVQIGSKVSVHKAAFGTNTKLEIEYTTHLVLFTNKNVTSVWLKKGGSAPEAIDVHDWPYKMLAYCEDLLNLKTECKEKTLLTFRHGIFRGALDGNALMFTNFPCSHNLLRDFIHEIQSFSNLAKIIKFTSSNITQKYFSKNNHCATTAQIIKEIFNAVSLTNILIACLLEARILFVSANSISAHAHAIEYIIQLIFPFKWAHLIEPIIPSSKFLEFLQMPFPFICGIPIHFLDEEISTEEIIIFNIDTGKIIASNYFSNIFEVGLPLANKLEKIFKPVLQNIDNFSEPSIVLDNFLDLNAILLTCHEWIESKIFNLNKCASVINDEVFFDEDQFVKLSATNLISEQLFLLGLSRTQHFSVLLTERYSADLQLKCLSVSMNENSFLD